MTGDELRRIADSVGGARNLAKLLGVGKDWPYRRFNKASLDRVDDLAVRKAMEESLGTVFAEQLS